MTYEATITITPDGSAEERLYNNIVTSPGRQLGAAPGPHNLPDSLTTVRFNAPAATDKVFNLGVEPVKNPAIPGDHTKDFKLTGGDGRTIYAVHDVGGRMATKLSSGVGPTPPHTSRLVPAERDLIPGEECTLTIKGRGDFFVSVYNPQG